jgi:hypothetical protein
MKKIYTLILFFISFITISQEIYKERIVGKIIIEGTDIEGVTVSNKATGEGTITNQNGEFIIEASLNDLLEIRALKYQNIDVLVNEDIIESKKLSIFLIEEVNKLDEIVILSKKLTGNLNVDLNRANKFYTKRDVIYFGIKKQDATNLQQIGEYQNDKIIMNAPLDTYRDGLNIVNVVDQLLIPLFRSEVKDKKNAGVPEVPAESIKYYFGSNFLAENFNIPKHRVEEFIRYVENDDSFDFDLLNYGHEIEFLELLTQKSKSFLKPKSLKD